MEEDETLGMDLFDLDLSDLNLDDDIQENEDDLDDDPNKDNDPGGDDDDSEENDDQENVADKDKDTDEEDDPNSDKEKASTTSPDLYKSLVNVLADEGVLTEVADGEDIKSVDDVIKLIKGEISKQEFADLNDLQKEAVEAYRAGIPVEKFNKQKEVEFQLEGITDDLISEDEDLRKQLIYQEFKLKGFSDEKAQKLTKRSFDADDDVDDAKAALQSLKNNVKESFKQEQAKLAKEKDKKIQKEKDQQKAIKDKVFKTDEIIKGYKINEGLKKKIYSEIYNPINTDPKTGRKENNLMKYQRENPEEFMHKLYYLFTVTKGFEDFEYFQNKERSKGVRELENALKKSAHVRSGGDPSFLDDRESFDFEIGDELVVD